jgi:hypothetical protein
MRRRHFFGRLAGLFALGGTAAVSASAVSRSIVPRLKAWRINEYEVYAGTVLDEAIAAAMKNSGNSRDETFDDSYGWEEPPRLSVREDTEEESYTTIGAILAEMDRPGMVCAYDV